MSLPHLPRLLPLTSHNDIVIVIAVCTLLAILTWLTFRNAEADDIVQFTWDRPPEADPDWKGVPLNEPCLHPVGRPSSQITCYDPSTAYELQTIPSLTAQDMSDLVAKAETAWRKSQWNKSSFARRRRVLRSLLAWCLRDMQAIAEVCCRDTGKTLLDAALGEVLVTCEKLRYCIVSGEEALKPSYRKNPWMLAHKTSYVKYEPFGLVGAIVSWNYPFHNLISPIIAAIITGNAIVVKTSENIAWSSAHFAKAIRSCLEACGEDPDIVQVAIGCEAEAAASFTRHKRLLHLLFIGSDAVGKQVARIAAEALTPVTLELGGKDPAVVLNSADLETFAQSMLKGSFTGAGQGCIAIERFICQEGIYDEFIRTMEPLVRKLRPGIDVGAMINSNRLPVLERLVQDAVKQGAKLLVGGKRYNHPQYPHASYFEPTMLCDVTADMEIAQQECFAPIMLVIKARGLDHCIELANASPYGLGSSVWGRNKADCKHVADNLVCGMVAINDFATFYICQGLPFGGVKHSGYARFGGPEGLRSLCNVKSLIEDKWHGVIQTPIPGPVQYPIRDKNKAFAFVAGTINLFYGQSWTTRWRGIRDLVR